MSDTYTEIVRLGCRYLLRVYVSILARSATSTLTSDVASVVMRASKALYQVDTVALSSRSRGKSTRQPSNSKRTKTAARVALVVSQPTAVKGELLDLASALLKSHLHAVPQWMQ